METCPMLRERLSESLKQAIHANQRRKASTLRLILAAIKDRDESMRAGDDLRGLSDQEIDKLLEQMIQQREKSSAAYEKAGEYDEAQKERDEIGYIQPFLPRRLSEQETEAICQDTVAVLDAGGLKDLARVMGVLKSKYRGQMDFGKAQGFVKRGLGG